MTPPAHYHAYPPANYRDLSKPMGCQSTDREAKFREKYEHSKEGAAPAFHFGTHYSTPGFVLMWLLRVEPFTSLFIKLQGGKFDMPCRIFGSMAQAWDNTQRDSNDVKVNHIRHTTYDIRHTTYYILRTTYYIRHTTYYILHTTYFVLHTT